LCGAAVGQCLLQLLQVMGELGIGKQQQPQQPTSVSCTPNAQQPSQLPGGQQQAALLGVAAAAALGTAATLDCKVTNGQAAAAAAAVTEEDDAADEEFAAMMADMQGLVLRAEQLHTGDTEAGCGADGGSGSVSRETSEDYGEEDAGNTQAMVSTHIFVITV
jgi:hypothetical protein